MVGGCSSWTFRKKEEQYQKEMRLMKEKLRDPDRPRLVGEVATPLGLTIRRLDALALVSNLAGTGGSVEPGPQRDMILNEMRRRDVLNPDSLLDAPSTALAKVRIFSVPGEIKSDNLDILVECSTSCNAKDLRDGYVLPTDFREYMLVGGRNRSSGELATGNGEVVVFPASMAEGDKVNPLRGVVIGGGKLKDVPKLGIRVNKEWRHVMITGMIAESINNRFFYKEGSRQVKVATAKNDWHIAIETMPKYRWDTLHYMSTLLAVGYGESPEQIAERIEGCRKLLIHRETSRRAACELEAIGKGRAIDVLCEGLMSVDTEVRFHSAYSLAYLDRPEGVPVLRDIAIQEPAFRPLCLIGLSINEHPSSMTTLMELLQESDPEVRYGALVAIRRQNPRHPLVVGEPLGEICHWISIPSKDPMVAVSMEQRKEVVVFGGNSNIDLQRELAPTPSLRMVPLSGGFLRVAKRQQDGEILQSIISNDLHALLNAMPTVNANYGDVVHLLDQLGSNDCMATKIAINPHPHAGRTYQRDTSDRVVESESSTTVKIDDATRSSGESKSSWLPTLPWMNFKSSGKTEEPSSKETQDEESMKEEQEALGISTFDVTSEEKP